MRLGLAMKVTACVYGAQQKLQVSLANNALSSACTRQNVEARFGGNCCRGHHAFLEGNGLGVKWYNVEDTLGGIASRAIQAGLLPVGFCNDSFRQVRFQGAESVLYRVVKIVNQLTMRKWSIVD